MRTVIAAALALSAGPLAAQQSVRRQPFVQVSGGMLNPSDPFQTTLAFGIAAGIDAGPWSLSLHARRQSQNRNSGDDLGRDGRTFVTAVAEVDVGRSRGRPARQAAIQGSAGLLFRSPFAVAPAVGVGVSWQLELTTRFAFHASLFDDVAVLADENYTCTDPFGGPTTCTVRGGPQHNFGAQFGVRFRP